MTQPADIERVLRTRLDDLCAEGWAIFERFDLEVRDHHFHPFIASEYEVVLDALMQYRGQGVRFLEWGSASGVITIMADLLGYSASGIEIDASLVQTARTLAEQFDSGARFVVGSFLPTEYRWQPASGDGRTGTVGSGPSGYSQLGQALDDFDVVFCYPWGGEEPMMLDLMKRYGSPDAVLLIHGVNDGVKASRGGREPIGVSIGVG